MRIIKACRKLRETNACFDGFSPKQETIFDNNFTFLFLYFVKLKNVGYNNTSDT